MPLLFALLPVLTTVIYVPEALHLWLVIIVMPISAYALLAGRGGNWRLRVFVLAGSGLMLLFVGATALEGQPLEILTTVAGSLLLAAAHILNWRRRHGSLRAAGERSRRSGPDE